MNTNLICGYGDPATWGPCVGHPHDPRTDPEDEEMQDREADLRIDRAIAAANGRVVMMLRDAGAISDDDWDLIGEGVINVSDAEMVAKYDPERTKLHEWLAEREVA